MVLRLRPLLPHVRVVLLILCVVASNGALLLNETFHTLDNWVEDVNGATGVIQLLPMNTANDPSVAHTIFTNITQCSATNDEDTCYRAEVATLQSLRPTLFPNCSVEYWVGFSSIIPSTWKYDETGDSLIYNFQLHGGVNDGKPPILGIRIQDNTMTANVCGSTDDLEYTCQYYNLGKPVIGSYVDWVIHSKLAFSLSPRFDASATSDAGHYSNLRNPSASALGGGNGDSGGGGFIQIWRNNYLLVSVDNLLTSYNQPLPPYMKFGSYVESWKAVGGSGSIGDNWASVTYRELRLGDQGSSYDEVYTGNGEPCGAPCDDLFAEGKKRLLSTLGLELIVIPLGIIILLSCMFYRAAMVQQRHNQRQKREQRTSSTTGPGHRDSTGSSEYTKNVLLQAADGAAVATKGDQAEVDASTPRSESVSRMEASLLNSFQVWWADYNKPRQDTHSAEEGAAGAEDADAASSDIDYDVAHSPLWQASQCRRTFWYLFGYFFLLCAIVFAAILYGRPVAHTHGLLPWARLRNWTAVQATLILVSGIMMIVYFLPLAYLPHDFDAGRAWKNDPKFLRKIGVVIPCHKSEAEIGEVVRRVLMYIPPENIVICDNGNFPWPTDKTFEVVKAQHPSVRYCFIQQGHKTRALWTGVHRLPAHCEYVMHLDDDTHLSEHMVFDEGHFTGKNEGFVISVAFLRSSYKINGVTKFTDFWYKITDHFHGTQAVIATRSFVPGPAGLWKRSKFIEIFGKHPSLPFGEDIFGGFTTLNSGYCIRTENRCMVTTFAPPILMNLGGMASRAQGYGASSLWKQRAHRWTVSALRITGKSLYSFFTYDTRGGVMSNIAFRLYRFREYKIIMVQLIYIPFCLVIVARGFFVEFVLLKLMLFLLPLFRNLCINYVFWRNQPEMQVDLRTVLLSPFYNFFLICCAIHGRWKCLLWYLPNVPPNHGMLQRLRPGPMNSVRIDSPGLLESAPCKPTNQTVEDTQSEQESPSTPSTPSSSKASSRQVAPSLAEQLVTGREDTFELFDRDGPGSSISVYESKKEPSTA